MKWTPADYIRVHLSTLSIDIFKKIDSKAKPSDFSTSNMKLLEIIQSYQINLLTQYLLQQG